ncbi:Galactinol synthase 2 [Camellia lanceoleosa]|uniref:Galactinol synthase 2 n=1 Tax=Camellia lanceoleosa TaxID=1840588 RepID=A0ACC0I7B7_9ERIC|nr:Galactinol synthase 2 [Camellia lanceoleosa]
MAPDLVTTTTKSTTAGLGKAASLTSQAYVTFLAGNGDYVKGVVGLAKGLRKVKSAYPLVVAILPDVPEEHRRILVAQGCIVREIEPVYPPENQTQFAMAYYVINYSKLRIWEFVEYHKMIYLDADIQVYDNIDHLFDMPNELGPQPACYFNAGMFVHEPNLSIYDDLLKTLKITPPTPFAEQDFLNMFFRKMYKPIPPVYNLILPLMWRHPENFELDKVKVVHYCAADQGSKPWRYTGKEANMDREDIKMLVKKWWDIYNDESLDYKRTDISIADSDTDKIMVALAEAGGVNFITSIAAPSAA